MVYLLKGALMSNTFFIYFHMKTLSILVCINMAMNSAILVIHSARLPEIIIFSTMSFPELEH